MPRCGFRDAVILVRIREERAVGAEASQPALELRAKALEVIGAHLVDRDEDQQRRRFHRSRRRRARRLLRLSAGGGDGDENRRAGGRGEAGERFHGWGAEGRGGSDI